nr:ribonuclease H-like domain-containing protein [Tanacetum cinerariifolium]
MEEEDSRPFKRISESQEDKAAKKKKLDEEVEELRKHLQIVPNDDDNDVYTEATPLALKRRLRAKCTSSNLEKSKKCSWFSEGQKMETVRVLWCVDYNIHYNTVDLAGREKISTYKVYSGSNAKQFKLRMLIDAAGTKCCCWNKVLQLMALLTMRARRFLKNTRKKFSLHGNKTIGFDKSKVECYNCYKRGHIARECRALKSQNTKHKESTRRIMPVEIPALAALVSCDGLDGYDWSDHAEDGPTNFALMAYSSTSSKSEVSTYSNCSSSCLENTKILKEQKEQLLKDLSTSKINAITYKIGLESVEARLLVYKKNKPVYEEDIKILKRKTYLIEVAITELRMKLELAQKQKDEIQLTIENFENSSKNLSKLLHYQIDKCKTGLGYNAVLPPYTRNFFLPKPNLSSLEEFVNEPIVTKPTVKKPVSETSEAKASADKPKFVRKNFGPSLIEDWISDSEDEAELKPKIKKKTIKPSFSKIEFVKTKEQVKSPRKTIVKQGNPQIDLQDKGVIDSGCSRHMTGNMSYLTDYKEIDGEYVAFGGKFDGKANEGFFIGYSLNSNVFRVFNNRTRIVEENLHIRFSENTPNIAGSGLNWLFDIDALTKSMNYKPVVARNQSNGNTGTKACNDAVEGRPLIVTLVEGSALCDGVSGCALLRQELEENLVTYSPDFQNSSEPSNASTNVVNAPREPYNSLNDSPSISETSSQSPPNINHCCYECGDPLDGIFCKRCTCKSCGKDAHIVYNCPSKVLVISNPEPCNNQTIDELPQTLPIFHSTFQSEAESPFTLDPTPTYVDESPNVFNPPPQPPVYPCEFCGNNAYYGHYCTPHAPFNYSEPTLAKIKDQMTSITSSCEMACQVAQKKLEEKQIEEERAAKAKNWKLPVCYDDDDEEERSDSLDDSIISGLPPFSEITHDEPVLSTEEPDNSVSMGDEHLDTIPATESDKFIKSGVETLIPIPSESTGIPEHVCDVPSHDNSSPLDVLKDQFEDFFESNETFSSINDDSFSIDDIDYVEASPPDFELVCSEVMEIVIPEVGGLDDDILLTIKDDILREKLLNVNLLIAKIKSLNVNPTSSFDCKKIKSLNVNPTSSSDCKTKSSSTSLNSLLEETNTFDNSLPEFEFSALMLKRLVVAVPLLILIFLFRNMKLSMTIKLKSSVVAVPLLILILLFMLRRIYLIGVELSRNSSQEDVNLKFLRSLPSEWKTHTLIWRNKADLEEQSLDDLFNSLKICEVLPSQLVLLPVFLLFVSSLPNIDSDDLEEMDLKWQMAMLTMRARRFLQRTGRNLGANGPTSLDFYMSKGHFARKCRSPKDSRRNGAAEPQRRSVPVETSTSNALVSQCDGVGKSDESWPPSSLYDRFQPSYGYHVETDHHAFNVQLSPTTPEQDLSHINRPTVPLIEDWVSDFEDESETKAPQIVLSFVQSTEQVKSPRNSIQHKIRRYLGANGPTSMVFDMSKVECYNSHRKGHFARECRSLKDSRRNGAAEPHRRTVPVETSTSNALVSQCDGVGSYDWSYQVEEEHANYALMAFSSSSSSSDNEVFTRAIFYTDDCLSSESDASWPSGSLYDRFQPCDGYHAVPPLYTETFMPPKPDLVFNTAPTAVKTDHSAFTVLLSPTKPDQDLSHPNRPSTPIIKEWVFNSEDESKTKAPQIVPSFIQSTEQVKSPRHSVQHVRTSISVKPASPTPITLGKRRNRKACFVCKSLDHLIKDCDYHAKKMAQPTPKNHAHRGNHKQYAPLTHTNPQKHMVPIAVLTQSKPVSITTVRPVSADVPKIKVTRPSHTKPIVTKSNSPIRRHLTYIPYQKSSNSPLRVTAVKAPVGNPQHALKDKGVIDSGCSRHLTGNVSYLSDFKELNGGYVAFRGNPQGGKISEKGKIRTGKFNGKVDEGFIVGYSVSSKASRVFNSRTRIVQETLHVNFLENKPNVTSSGPTWLFDIDNLTKTMNYQLVTARNQTNPSAGFQDKFVAEKEREEIDQKYVLFPVWSFGSTNPQKNDGATAFDGKEPDFDAKKPESEVNVSPSSRYKDLSAEFEDCYDNNINEVNAAGSLVPTVGRISPNSTNTFSDVGPLNAAASPTLGNSSFIDASQLPDDTDMPELKDITYSNDEDDVGPEADFNNLETPIKVSPIPTIRVHKDHPVSQIIGDLSSTTQTISMTRVVKDQGGLSQMFNDDFHTCMFTCFLLQEEPKRSALRFAQRDKDMQKNLAFIAKYFKKIYKPTNNNLRTSSNSKKKNVDTTPRYKNDDHSEQFRNQRTLNVAGAREKVGIPVVQQYGIQCYSFKEYGHFAKECRKPKRYDWLADTDEEVDEQELEAHYSYMAKIQEVPTADSGTDSEPVEQVQNDAGYNVFANHLQYSEQFEFVSNTCLVETDDSNVIPYSPDMCEDDIQNEQNDVESDDELLIPDGEETLALERESRSKLNKDLVHPYDYTKLNSLYEIFKPLTQEYETQLAHANEIRRKMWRKYFVKSKPNIYKNIGFLPISKSISKSQQAYNVMKNNINHFKQIVDDAWIKHSKDLFRAPTAQDMEVLIQTRLMPLAIKTQSDSLKFVHELKQEMHADLKYVESIEKEIDELESDKTEFSDMYDVILQDCLSKDVMCSYLMSLSNLDALDELQYLKAQLQDKNIAISVLKKLIEKGKQKSVDTKFDRPSVVRQLNAQRILKPSILGKPIPFSDSVERKYFPKTKSILKTNVSEGLLKPVTAQTLPTKKKSCLKNTNVLAPGMYKIHTDHTQTRTLKLPQDSKKTNKRVSFSTGVIPTTSVSRPQLKSNPQGDRVLRSNSRGKKLEVEDLLIEIVLFIVDFGCSKHMTGNLKLLINFVEKFLGTVKFRNDQIAPILGYGDLVQGAVTIKRVYYVKGLNHNLFSVG